MTARLPIALTALLLLLASGCKTASPFVGKWTAVSGPAEMMEEVGSASLTLDADGYALAQASEKDGDESVAIEAQWEQVTPNRMEMGFEFDEEEVRIIGWLTGADQMTATLIVGEEHQAVTVDLERAKDPTRRTNR